MEILIIEDERPSADRLLKLLAECRPEAKVTAVLGSVREGKEYFLSGKGADLVISDISLPDGLCFSIFENQAFYAPIVFTTAYDEYAIRAFDYNSIAYLLKPIRKEDLEKALSKAARGNQTPTEDLLKMLRSLSEGNVKWRERILVENGDESRPIRVSDIACFNYDLGTTKVMMRNGSSCLCGISLDRLEEQLNPDCFLRVSRQFIVNIEDVQSIKRVDTKHSVIKLNNSDEGIVTTNIRCNRLKLMLDK